MVLIKLIDDGVGQPFLLALRLINHSNFVHIYFLIGTRVDKNKTVDVKIKESVALEKLSN